MDHPAYVVAIGRRINEKRRKPSARTTREAAKEIGIAPSTLSRIERGGNIPDLETFRRICIWLGESADTLLELRRETN